MAALNDRASGSVARSSAGTGVVAGAPGPVSTFAETAAQGDPLAAVLRSVRLTGALFFVVDASSPWCVDIPHARAYAPIIFPRAEHIVSYHVIVEGTGFASIPGVEPVSFESGDIILFPHGDPYLMESTPGTEPEFDAAQTLDFFRELAAGRLPFVVREGGGAPPSAQFICGFLGCDLRPFNPVLSSLPRMLRLRRSGAGGDVLDKLIELTLEEAQASRAGGESVRLRLSELLFIELLRRYAGTPEQKPPGWLAGFQDGGVARALQAIHNQPQENWTVSGLARAAGCSRSVLAARFTELVGHPPAGYLKLWRMQIASSMLSETDEPIAEVGYRVGYASEAAFSRTFKKIAGVSPDGWRRARRDQLARGALGAL